jgi:hypothetical protein
MRHKETKLKNVKERLKKKKQGDLCEKGYDLMIKFPERENEEEENLKRKI